MSYHIVRAAQTGRGAGDPADGPEWMANPDKPCHNNWDLWTSDNRDVGDTIAPLCRQRRCPVIQQCLQRAIDNGERQYVWGGVNFSNTAARNRVMRKAAGRPARGTPPRHPVEPERTLTGAMARHALNRPELFAKLTDQARIVAVRHGRGQGHSWSQLAQIWSRKIDYLQKLAGEPTMRERVRALYDAGRSDSQIALTLDVNSATVAAVRKRLGLPAQFGPGGRRLWEVAA